MTYHYYDTCVFESAQNPTTKCHRACALIVDAAHITWGVCTCPELVVAEAPIDELLEQFEANCARNGINYLAASLGEAKTFARKWQPQKRALKQLGFSGNDWWHLCGALSASCVAVVSADEDFFDPENKADPGRRKSRSRVKDFIEETWDVLVLKPELCPC